MIKIKTALVTALSVAGAFAAASASAASYQVWNGTAWSATGTTHFTGPTSASYLGNSLPCTANFTFAVTAGVAKVTAASFSGSSACTNIIARGLPWTVAAPVASGSNWSVTIGGSSPTTTAGGVNVFIPAPLNANCPSATGRGPVTGTLVNSAGSPPGAASFTFNSALGPCAVKSNPTLSSTVPVRAI